MTPPHVVAEARRRAAAGEYISSVARDLGIEGGTLWHAVRGRTYAWLLDPPPVPVRPRPTHCHNPPCGRPLGNRPGRYCSRCTQFRYRHGHYPHDARTHPQQLARTHPPDLADLYRRYQAGRTLRDLAHSRPFSRTTLARRFTEAGLALRPSNRTKRVLNPGRVHQLRQLHYHEQIPIAELGRLFSLPYHTIYCAIKGHNWKHLPMPAEALQAPNIHQQCHRCGLLTAGPRPLCYYCQQETRP